jgi:hypothetical protein
MYTTTKKERWREEEERRKNMHEIKRESRRAREGLKKGEGRKRREVASCQDNADTRR